MGWMRECGSAWDLATDAYARLLAREPNHELLKYLDPKRQKALHWEEMKDRFWDKERGPWEGQRAVIVQTVVLTNYYFAIKEALVNRLPKSAEESPKQEEPLPKNIEDAEVPF